MTWRDDAVCLEVGTEPFFPPSGVSAAPAIRICLDCPVRAECLEAALAVPYVEDYGVYGGTTRYERKRMREAA